MLKQFLLILPVAALAACSSTPTDLQSRASAKTEIRTYTENYQEIYRRVSMTAKRCAAGSAGYASGEVDTELYNELGYGEVTYSIINVGFRNYFWKAKIEKVDPGSKMTVTSGNTVNNSIWMNRVLRWADGDESC